MDITDKFLLITISLYGYHFIMYHIPIWISSHYRILIWMSSNYHILKWIITKSPSHPYMDIISQLFYSYKDIKDYFFIITISLYE